MILSTIFTDYKPEGKDPNYLYLISEDDIDWYDFRDSLEDTEGNIYLALTDTNDIRSVTCTKDLLWPNELKIANIDISKLPDDLQYKPYNSFSGEWVYDEDNDEIVKYQLPHDVLVQQAQQKKDELLAEASNQIDILTDINDPTLNDNITDDEKQSLIDWRKYRMAVYNVDVNLAPDIEWPVAPAK